MSSPEIPDRCREVTRELERCECGCAVTMAYEPGCHYIYCNGERQDGRPKTVDCLADGTPEELRDQWNAKRRT